MIGGDWATGSVLAGIDPCRIFARNGRVPYPYQVELVRNRPHRGLVCWGRQSGKSSAASALSLSQAFYRAPSLIVVSSFAERQSKELLRKAMELYAPYSQEFPLEIESKTEVAWKNGSRMVALPGKADSARSFSGVDLVLLDEAGWTSDDLRSVIDALLSTTDGDLIAMSTPPEEWGGWWLNTWTQGGRYGAEESVEAARGDGWTRSLVRSADCPSITPEFLAASRADAERIGALRSWQREYECRFPDRDTETSRPFADLPSDWGISSDEAAEMPAVRL